MLCLAVNDRNSMERIKGFKAEIKTVNPNAPILLVATKFDMRDGAEEPISKQELEQMRLDHGFQGYVETSSKEWRTNQNVREAFAQAIRLSYYYKYPDAM